MNAWRAAAGLLLTLAANAQAEMTDLFTGTLEKQKEEWVLVRCDLAKQRYLLRDADGASAGVDALLPPEAKVPGAVFTVSLAASYLALDGRHALRVLRLQGAKRGSCHLDALFE
ncbi:hypothetical protein [Chromobacterium phragmitis]|uniref:Lysozyme inhibitor n=1 Tax=Chromobacterium phragmitis TaxID=2202141 RepID=A0ABV0IX80_9NEIS